MTRYHRVLKTVCFSVVGIAPCYLTIIHNGLLKLPGSTGHLSQSCSSAWESPNWWQCFCLWRALESSWQIQINHWFSSLLNTLLSCQRLKIVVSRGMKFSGKGHLVANESQHSHLHYHIFGGFQNWTFIHIILLQFFNRLLSIPQ